MDLKRAQGWTSAPVEFAVGEHLCVPGYAKALGLDDAEFCRLDAAIAAGRSGRPVPAPMFAFFHVVPTDVVTDELGFTWGRTLGAGVDVESHRVATDGDRLTGSARVDAVWEKIGRDGAARQFLRLTTEFRSGDDLVCRNSVLFMERKEGPADDAFVSDAEPPRDIQPFGLAAPAVAPLPLQVGAPLPTARLEPVDRLMLARMSVAIDNPDPIHIDEAAARAAGLPGVIGHGTTVVGLLYEPVRRWAGLDRPVSGRTTQSRPFGPGTALVATGRVVAVRREGAHDIASCETVLNTADGESVGRATFDVVVA